MAGMVQPRTNSVLGALLDVCQGVRAASEATTLYRQRLALEEQVERLAELKKALAWETPGDALQYGGIIDGWSHILASAARILEERSRGEEEIRPVYVAGPALRPREARELFKGRKGLFSEIEGLALGMQPPVLVLQGQRRTGKTSLLEYLPERTGAGLVPVTVSAQRVASAETNAGLAYEFAQSIAESARRARELTLPEPARKDFDKDPFVALRGWLSLLST